MGTFYVNLAHFIGNDLAARWTIFISVAASTAVYYIGRSHGKHDVTVPKK